MKVFKFGGASVKNAGSIRNLGQIVRQHDQQLLIVVSAMGKSTNALESITHSFFECKGDLNEKVSTLKKYHLEIVHELFDDEKEVVSKLEEWFQKLDAKLSTEPSMNYNFEYDQIVSFGELISTTIISAYLSNIGVDTNWLDARKVFKTDNSFREGKINFQLSQERINALVNKGNGRAIVSQGFIASNENNLTTTLGREGSDYSAALFAYFLNAESVTVWKDVPGVLNADPKWFDETEKLERISYTDAIELAFYGASVIHPKTIQPLKKKNIPLFVRSFNHPEDEGTAIGEFEYEKLIPSFIFKMDQVILDIHPRDLSFIAEENLKIIFSIFAKYGLKINLMQNTAVSFKVCVGNDTSRIPSIINELQEHFDTSQTTGLELVTIRYYDDATIQRVMVNKEMILQQRSRQTIQLVVRDLGENY